MIQTIDTSDTPNAGRVKINSNFEEIDDSLASKISNDGTTLMQAPLNMNGYRAVNAGAAINDNDYVTKTQMVSENNQLITNRTIYIVPEFNQSNKILFLDGTNSEFGVKVDRIDSALNFIQSEADATFGNEWSIQIPYNNSYYRNENFSNFGNYINLYGVGRPVIEIIDGTTSGVSDIIGNSKLRGITLIYKDGKELNIGGNVKIDDCDIFLVNTSGFASRKITIGGASVTNTRMIADEIILDSTTGNYVDDCTINIENFTNPNNNEINVTNKSILNLENYFETYLNI